MSNPLGERFKLKGTYLLLLAGALLLCMLFVLGSYKPIHCSTLCISSFSSKGSYAIEAAVSYAGSKLPNASVVVVINNMYKSTIKTNYESTLQFQAPLRVGINTIKAEYGNSESSIMFFYTGGLLYVVLIPLSAIFFLLMKKFASDSASRNEIVFYYNDQILPSMQSKEAELKYAFDSVIQKNKRMITGLPERISDVSLALSSLYKLEGKKKMKEDSEYLSKKMETFKIAHVLHNCASHSPLTKQIVGGKIFYENAILSGSPMALKTKSPKVFLDTNNILLQTDLSISNLKLRHGKLNLILLDEEEKHALSRAFRTYSKLGASLLVMKLSNILGVTD